MLLAVGGLQAMLLCQVLPQFDAGFKLLIQQLGNRCTAAFVADAAHYQRACDWPLAQHHRVAHLDFFGRLDFRVVDADPALVNFLSRQAAGFVKACGPQPFVDA